MKKTREKRFFANHENLRAEVKHLQDDLAACKFRPQKMPGAVLRLGNLYMKLLHEDWLTLQTGSKVAFVPSDKYPGLSEGNLTMRADALKTMNQFFNNNTIDMGRNKEIQKYVPEMADFENYLQFLKMRQEYMSAVLSVLASALVSTSHSRYIVYKGAFQHKWEDRYPKDIQKIRDIFKDINFDIHGCEGKSDAYIYGKYVKLADLVLDDSHTAKNDLYLKTAAMIHEIKFAAPVVEAIPSLRGQ